MEQYPKLYAPKELTQENLSGHVISICGEDDSKPSIAMFNDKEMIMFTHHEYYEYDSHLSVEQKEKGIYTMVIHTIMYRTEDGGETWQCCGHMPFHNGYEASATVIDDVVYVQTHNFQDPFADHDRVIDYIFCSEDKGKTWIETRVDPAFLGTPEEGEIVFCRNFVQLSDGSVAGFIAIREKEKGYVIRVSTKDHGRTWKQERITTNVAYTTGKNRAILWEAFFFRTPKTNRLMVVTRVDWARFSKETAQSIPYSVAQESSADMDSIDGMLLLESKDEGLTWEPVRGLGYMGMMYPGVAYLNDNDFLFTYTKRTVETPAPYNHMGVQVILGREEEDGAFTLDFEKDIMIVDDRTPDYSITGHGYGVTQVLSDGSLITPYSYRVNEPELDEVIQSGKYNSEEVFWDYYRRTKQLYTCPTPDHFFNGSDLLRKHLIVSFSQDWMSTRIKTEVLKWKLELPSK